MSMLGPNFIYLISKVSTKILLFETLQNATWNSNIQRKIFDLFRYPIVCIE